MLEVLILELMKIRQAEQRANIRAHLITKAKINRLNKGSYTNKRTDIAADGTKTVTKDSGIHGGSNNDRSRSQTSDSYRNKGSDSGTYDYTSSGGPIFVQPGGPIQPADLGVGEGGIKKTGSTTDEIGSTIGRNELDSGISKTSGTRVTGASDDTGKSSGNTIDSTSNEVDKSGMKVTGSKDSSTTTTGDKVSTIIGECDESEEEEESNESNEDSSGCSEEENGEQEVVCKEGSKTNSNSNSSSNSIVRFHDWKMRTRGIRRNRWERIE